MAQDAALEDVSRALRDCQEELWQEKERREALERRLEMFQRESAAHCETAGDGGPSSRFEAELRLARERLAAEQASRRRQELQWEARMKEIQQHALQAADVSVQELRRQLHEQQCEYQRALNFIDDMTNKHLDNVKPSPQMLYRAPPVARVPGPRMLYNQR